MFLCSPCTDPRAAAMSASPSLRISLRRKRSTRSGENSGSPVIKKKSPKLSEPKESPCTPKTRTSRRPSTLSPSASHTSPRSATRTSPRLSRGRSTDKSDNEEKSFQTPASAKWTHASEVRLRQPSPDMPFLSSQLGTQECEVVWDCDSPGFTKEDLKRMHGGGEVEGPERAVAIAPAPPRQLFPHTRSRLARASASSNTMAQLNDLLDLLSSRENAGRKKQENQEEPPSLQPIVPPNDSHSEDSSSSESMVLPRPLGESGSQPFEVAGVCGARDTKEASLASDFDESVWGDDLNLGLCDISDSVLAECVESSKGRVGVQKPDTDRSRVPSETAEISSASADMFDDDLFSESVILSTQAVEEAMTVTKVTDVSNDKRDSSAEFSKKVHHELKNVILKDEENSRNIKKVENNSRNINISELHTGQACASETKSCKNQ
ncbi:hypothetical protein GWK47_013050 [Chionoecetes opilio]|uniref:Uncharacterized protein n=1 Tax=Chionoecetes opilio TaxID=41210 RepID=A0A8J5CKW4_CHIOP|nr:hypothetical protein GWK47_013050 [Chionoecetes opilio]